MRRFQYQFAVCLGTLVSSVVACSVDTTREQGAPVAVAGSSAVAQGGSAAGAASPTAGSNSYAPGGSGGSGPGASGSTAGPDGGSPSGGSLGRAGSNGAVAGTSADGLGGASGNSGSGESGGNAGVAGTGGAPTCNPPDPDECSESIGDNCSDESIACEGEPGCTDAFGVFGDCLNKACAIVCLPPFAAANPTAKNLCDCITAHALAGCE